MAVAWSNLKSDADGKIVTSITKDAAIAAAEYNYKDPTLREQVLAESGERYTVAEVSADGAETQTADTGSAIELGTPLANADGSLNASQLIGLDVESPEADKVGDVGEVVLDKGGQVKGVVVDVGGFLGMGAHPVLLDWKDVALTNQDGKAAAIVNRSEDGLEQMPTYERSKN